MPDTYRRLVLAQRPQGNVDASTLRLEEADRPVLAEGEALVEVQYLSIDPTIRTWMNDAPGYLPPIEIGAVVRSGGLGTVVESKNETYPVGTTVSGMLGWSELAVISAKEPATVVPAGIDPLPVMGVFGATGMTAYFGLLDIGQPREGDTVVVSGAAGATGSVVGQIARIQGAGNVVGIAGSDEKCAWLVDELGFTAAINYRTEPVARRLHELCPKGIDVYFDNVGGEILDAALGNLAMKARVVICGAISQYNERVPVGPRNYVSLIFKRARMEGFLIFDYFDRFAEAQATMFQWVLDGQIHHREHVVEGLEHAGDALNMLFTGENMGKIIVRL